MPLILPELKWMLVGESISFEKILYQDVWDNTAPISALVYSLIDTIGGRTQWGYQIIAVLALVLHCYLFNQLLIANKAYKENTYVPGLIYLVLMSVFFDFFTLSPVLMSGIFQLYVINGIFYHIAVKLKDEQFLNIGLAIGISALIYLPTLSYLPITILALGLYSTMTFKKYILLLFGFAFPVLLVGIYFFWHGALIDFVNSYFFAWTYIPFQQLVSFKTLLLISATAAVLMVLSWMKIYTAGRYNNHQTNFMLVMFLFLVAAFIMVFMSKERVPHQLMVFVTPVAFFISHYFLLIRRRWLAELVFMFFLGITLTLNYSVLYRFIVPPKVLEVESLVVKPTKWDQTVAGKKLLIIGSDFAAYRHAYPATPYLNWNLSRNHLEKNQAFDNLSVIYQDLMRDTPEVIIDQSNLVPELFSRMPSIASKYTRKEDTYILRN
jgi:hypothetical protein